MKLSTAMLEGFKKVNGRQTRGRMARYNKNGKAQSFCVMGAARAGGVYNSWKEERIFLDTWGIRMMRLNDDHFMAWEHIYGMARAAGV